MGVPWIIKTDNGPTYTSQQFNDFMGSLKIIHTACNSYITQGQAIIEHANHTIKERLTWVIYPKAKQATNFDLVEVLFHINFSILMRQSWAWHKNIEIFCHSMYPCLWWYEATL